VALWRYVRSGAADIPELTQSSGCRTDSDEGIKRRRNRPRRAGRQVNAVPPWRRSQPGRPGVAGGLQPKHGGQRGDRAPARTRPISGITRMRPAMPTARWSGRMIRWRPRRARSGSAPPGWCRPPGTGIRPLTSPGRFAIRRESCRRPVWDQRYPDAVGHAEDRLAHDPEGISAVRLHAIHARAPADCGEPAQARAAMTPLRRRTRMPVRMSCTMELGESSVSMRRS